MNLTGVVFGMGFALVIAVLRAAWQLERIADALDRAYPKPTAQEER